MIEKQRKIEELYSTYYLKHKKEDKIPLFGMVFGTELLFVGQNPGNPNVVATDLHRKIFENFASLDYKKQQETFIFSWKQSTFVKFIANVCSKLELDLYKDAAVTNFVKYWTPNNQRPQATEDDQKLLVCEIEILHPKLAVFLSKFVFNNFEYKNRVTSKCLSLDHPASRYYSEIYAQEVAAQIRRKINGS